MIRANKKLGILGGMGPSASCNWYRNVLRIIETKYNVSQDEEYPEIYVFSLSMKGWSERGIEDDKIVKEQLLSALKKMEYLGVDYIVMACNTAHVIYDYLQLNTQVPILNMIKNCVHEVNDKKYHKIGILSTETTNKNKLYETEFNKIGIDCITAGMPYEQKLISDVILSVQSGKCGKSENEIMGLVINKMKKMGVEAVVLGCTELPLSISQKDVDIPLIDPGYMILNKVTELLYENVPCFYV